jgi:hypothetical protein
MTEQDRRKRMQRLTACIVQGEDAYDQLYDPRSHTNPAGHYSEAKDSFGEAIGLARDLGLEDMALTLSDRLAHIKSVFRSQFS